MFEIPLTDIVMAFSSAIDLISPQLQNHHRRVAYIAYWIAKEMGLPEKDIRQIVTAGLLHDCGAIQDAEKAMTLEFDMGVTSSERYEHGLRGWHLLKNFEDLRAAAEIIRFHHIYWDEKVLPYTEGCEINPGSYIIHLADRIDVLIGRNEEILGQRKNVEAVIRQNRGTMFMPDAADSFFTLSPKDSFWFDMNNPFIDKIIKSYLGLEVITVDIEKLLLLASIINKIVDFRSTFTSTHSIGVAECARVLSGKMGFSKLETQMINVAGLLHDLGKLAIPVEILNKNGPLNTMEFNIMKKHAFYTFRIIEQIPQMEIINQWAAFHHERLDGRGYPFRMEGEALSLGSRIMAVSDVFTALTEKRPYREVMSVSSAISILDKMVIDKHLDGDVISVLKKHREEISYSKMKVQSTIRSSDEVWINESVI